jgi:asparagine N-glycosylation enzyme membrane subunit Stt3
MDRIKWNYMKLNCVLFRHPPNHKHKERQRMHKMRQIRFGNKKDFLASRLKIPFTLFIILIFQLIPHLVMAGGEGEKPELLETKVNLEGLSGISLFFARTYNENLWMYAIYCTILMAVVGILIAFVTDLILKAMGMEVEKIEHQE